LFGRFELRGLLGKSDATMVWLAFDAAAAQELVLTLPRVQPVDEWALDHWLRKARFAARLDHPNLAHVVEVGVHEHWPYVAVERALGLTLGEWLALHPSNTPTEVAQWMCDALRGLAFAHEAGVAHEDLQLHSLLIADQGQLRVMALAAAGDVTRTYAPAPEARSNERAMPMDPSRLRAQREAATRDVVACGVVMQHLLAGQPALDELDTARVMDRMPPRGRELVRLPWSTPYPIPEALRVIANRTTSSQERQRYRTARSLQRALDGWREAQAQDNGGPLALLLDRLRTVGHLPALPGLGARVARLVSVEGQRTDEMAQQVLHDMALSFELLRNVNSAQVQGTQIAGNGPVLTIRRTIALLGVDGVRLAANALRAWPGPLSDANAAALQRTMDHVRLAGHVAQALRPAGYDPEVVYLIAVLQNLGRLLVQYHFPDEAEQLRQLMQSAPPSPGAEPGAPAQPGMSEGSAAYAVLGVDIESLGAAVARHWGFGDEMLHMARRLPPGAPVRTADSDADVLRAAASAANELVDVAELQPSKRAAAALTQVAQRYSRVLGVSGRDVRDALELARTALRSGKPVEVRKTVAGNSELGTALG
jgi:non-specific serine/threonine protein kinase